MPYIAGTCNIGPAEIARRYRIGYVGLGLMVLMIAGIELIGLARFWRLMLVIPAVMTLSGFVQARSRFCMAYGWFGVFRIETREHPGKVESPEALRLDRRYALKLGLIVGVGSLLIAFIYYITP